MINIIGRALTRRCYHHPVFIVGASRSGTSVLLQALGKHPLIMALPGEAPYITSIGGSAYIFNVGEDSAYYSGTLKFPKAYLHELLRKLCFEYAAGKDYGLKLILQGLRNDGISFLKKTFWCAKTFPDFKTYQGLLALYPKMKVVYIVRNGLDVVRSRTKYMGFRKQEFEQHCLAWSKSAETYSYLNEAECAIVVRHEHMVSDSFELFNRIFQHIGIPANRLSNDFVNSNIVHPLDQSTVHHISVEKIFQERKVSFENWTPAQRNMFKSTCREYMKKLGYEIPF